MTLHVDNFIKIIYLKMKDIYSSVDYFAGLLLIKMLIIIDW